MVPPEAGPPEDAVCHAGATADLAAGSGSGSPLDRIRERLSEGVGKERLRRYFADGTTMSLEGERLDVTVPSQFMAEFLDRRFGAALRRAAQAAEVDGGGGPVTLRFRV
ncbi:MAG TPA: hypothetical protein PKU91_08600, partial [Phycisphaerales bacterium]|nr:hypothetical protein [Phycisphaerales bacterium]